MIEISKYKNSLMKEIFENQTIVDAIDSQSENYVKGENDTLIDENIFPYLRIPETQRDADCFVLMEVDVTNVNRHNKIYSDIRITLWVMCHQERMKIRLPQGSATRTDFIGEQLIEMLNGKERYGVSSLELVSSRGIVFNDKWQYREVVFKGFDLNREVCED